MLPKPRQKFLIDQVELRFCQRRELEALPKIYLIEVVRPRIVGIVGFDLG
jgi:hypothetical protein